MDFFSEKKTIVWFMLVGDTIIPKIGNNFFSQPKKKKYGCENSFADNTEKS